MLGIPLLEKFIGSLFLGFLVYWFVGFKDCVLEDIDPISKIFKICLHESSGFIGAHLSQISFFEIQDSIFTKLRFCENMRGF